MTGAQVERRAAPANAPPEPDLTPADLIARAVALRPKLIAAQADTEERTYHSEELHRDFLEAGFYRLYVPRRYGGYEFDVPTFMRLALELARGLRVDGLVRVAGIGARAADRIVVRGARRRPRSSATATSAAPSVAAPIGPARPVDGGWELNGKVAYCSGIPYSTHYMGQALIAREDGSPASGCCCSSRRAASSRCSTTGAPCSA